MSKLKVRGFSKGTHQFLTFYGAGYGGRIWPKVGSTSASFTSIRFPKLVAVKEGQKQACIEATR